jgi:tetratricopeptide (TPR) repeat protein
MRYRSTSTWDDISGDVAAFINLIGEDEYRRRLNNLGSGLRSKGYVTETDDLRFSLELQLLNLELLRRSMPGQIPETPDTIHEATDFLIGLGQTIPHLSVEAQTKLRGQIMGGLKTNGLRSLQHEMRVAGMISKLGCDVTFADLEGDGGYDFLAEKDGASYEIEAKSLAIFSGQPILPQDADKLFLVLRQKFEGWKTTGQIPILNIRVKDRLSASREDLLELVGACNTAAGTKQNVTLGSGTMVEFLGAIPEASYPRLALAARMDSLRTGINVYVSEGQPKVVAGLSSERPGKFVHNVISTISDSCKRQLSGNLPGIVWVHVDYVSPDTFDAMAYAKIGTSFFDLIALAVLDSPKREHLTQLIFSGGAHLMKKDDRRVSSFRRVVYTSPNSKFREAVLFREGKQWTNRDQPLRSSVAKALLNKATLNVPALLSKGPAAIYDDLVARFGRSTELPACEVVAAVLINKGAALGLHGHNDEAIAVYDLLLARFGSAPELSLRASVANALFNKGNVLRKIAGRAGEAIAVYDDVLARFGSSGELPLRELVAGALIGKGVALGLLGHDEEAIALYDDVRGRFGSAAELPLRANVANALFNKGNVLGKLSGRTGEAIAAYDDVLARFGSSAELPLRELVARALYNKGYNLCALGRHDEGRHAYDDVVARFGSATELSLREQAARALVNKGLGLGFSESAIGIYDDVLARFGSSAELPLREQIAKALINKGNVLLMLGRYREALVTFNDFLARFGSSAETPLREPIMVVVALLRKGGVLVALDRVKEALSVYGDLLSRFGSETELWMREEVAETLVGKGNALNDLDQSEDAIRLFDEVLALFGAASELPLRGLVAGALIDKGAALVLLGNNEEAIAVYDDVVARYGSATEPAVREQVAKALLNKGGTLGELGRSDQERAVYDDLLARFGNASEPLIREIVADAEARRKSQ